MDIETEIPRPVQGPSWIAVVGMLIAPLLMVCAWMISLSNRVAVLESEVSTLSTISKDVTTLIAHFEDLRRELDQNRVNDQVTKTRDSKP
jgi:hypothetical protein